MADNQMFETLGLTPDQLNAISGRQIQRDQNVINALGKAMTHKVSSARQQSEAERSATLNRLTETQIYQNEPVMISVGENQFQTTRGNMSLAMQQLSRGLASQASTRQIEVETEQTQYENQPIDIEINGDPFQIRRNEFKQFSEILAKQEELGIKREEEDRAQVEADRLTQGIKELSTVAEPSELSAETAAKTGVLGTWLAQKGKGVSAADERNRQALRTNWGKLNVELNTNPENPLALASSANQIAEELGENVVSVVFSEGFAVPGLGLLDPSKKDIPVGGIVKMDKLRNPNTNKLMTITDVRKQAELSGMSLNDALQILYIHGILKDVK